MASRLQETGSLERVNDNRTVNKRFVCHAALMTQAETDEYTPVFCSSIWRLNQA